MTVSRDLQEQVYLFIYLFESWNPLFTTSGSIPDQGVIVCTFLTIKVITCLAKSKT